MATAFNFPADPDIGEQITLSGGNLVEWTGDAWVNPAPGSGSGGGGSDYIDSDTNPGDLPDGTHWWVPSSGQLFLRTEGVWAEVGNVGEAGDDLPPTSNFTTAVRTIPVDVPFVAGTTAIDASLSNVFFLGTTTDNTTLSITNGADGQTINIRTTQDSTGGHTIALGSDVLATPAGTGDANEVVWLIVTYVGSASRWEGAWSLVPA